MSDLQTLLDHAAIRDVVIRFGVALDARDWPRFRSCLAGTVDLHYPDSVGIAEFTGDELTQTATRFFSRLDATLHLSGNHQITLDGDHAVCESSLFAQHYLAAAGEDAVQRQVGSYRNHLQRFDDGWRITRSEQHVRWSEGNPAVFAHAAAAFS